MNLAPRVERHRSTCPHDCPSTCGLDVEVIDGRTIGRVRGSEDHSYTAGVICAKVARYAERIHHPDRLTAGRCAGPVRRDRASSERISWDEALDRDRRKRFLSRSSTEHGGESDLALLLCRHDGPT